MEIKDISSPITSDMPTLQTIRRPKTSLQTTVCSSHDRNDSCSNLWYLLIQLHRAETGRSELIRTSITTTWSRIQRWDWKKWLQNYVKTVNELYRINQASKAKDGACDLKSKSKKWSRRAFAGCHQVKFHEDTLKSMANTFSHQRASCTGNLAATKTQEAISEPKKSWRCRSATATSKPKRNLSQQGRSNPECNQVTKHKNISWFLPRRWSFQPSDLPEKDLSKHLWISTRARGISSGPHARHGFIFILTGKRILTVQCPHTPYHSSQCMRLSQSSQEGYHFNNLEGLSF